MSKVVFIGLGIMGLPMALNLSRRGYDVTGVVRPGKTNAAALEGGLRVVDDAIAVVADADVVITMLPDTPDVEAAVSSIQSQLAEGSLVVDMSTIEPGATRSIGERLGELRVGFIDAPVSGGESGAVDGVLSIMAGGSESDFRRALPLFEAMGRTIVHVGPIGAGQVVKAANQLIVAGNIQMVAEAITFLRAQGADLEASLAVINGGLAGSTVLTRKRAAFLEQSYAPGFRLSLHGKDLGIVEAAAATAGLALPLTAAVTQLVRASIARGDGGLDHSALLKLTGELNARDE